MAGRGTDIMLGGNPEFLADIALRERGLDPVETLAGVRGGVGRGRRHDEGPGRGRGRGGQGRGRALRAGHRAARVAPHRQPAPRPLRAPGRPRRVPLLPLARRRADAAVQRRRRRVDHDAAQAAGRRPDRGGHGHARPSAARRPRSSSRTSRSARTSSSTTRCSTSSAPSSTTSGASCSRARTSKSRSRTCSPTSSPPTSTARRPTATPRTGTSTSCGRALRTLYPVGIDKKEITGDGR